MGKLFRLYLLELKNAFKNWAKSLILLAMVVVTVTTFVYGYIHASTNDNEDEKIVMGVVLQDKEDTLFPELISFSNGISSLKGFCRLEIFDEEEAFNLLHDGEIQMVMVVPEGFMEAAEHMQEATLAIYMSGELTRAEYKILAVFSGVEEIMLSTEGAILSMYDGMSMYEFSVTKTEMEDDMMRLFVMNFLGRDSYFETEFLSLYGTYNAIQYYIVSLSLLFIWISSVFYLGMYNRNIIRLEGIMSNSSPKKGLTAAVKIVIISIPIMLTMSIFLVAGLIIKGKYELFNVFITGHTFFCAMLIALAMASFVQIISMITEDKSKRVMLFLLIVMIISILSASVSSIYYLPDVFRKISGIWLMSGWQHLMLGDIFESIDGAVWKNVIISLSGMFLLGSILYTNRLKKR